MALGHFHETVGESPRSDENLGSWDLVSFPRYGHLKLELLFDRILNSKI